MYTIAHDLGTSGNKAVLYSEHGQLVKSVVKTYPLHVSGGGSWAEQSADDWFKAVADSTKELLDGIDPSEIAAVSFSGQMMGCLCVDQSGAPLRNAIIWADQRSVDQEEQVRSRISMERFYQLAGHRISCSWGAFKFLWIKQNQPEIYAKTYLTLNAKDYILYKLTGTFATEYSDASSLCLMDINRFEWSDELFDAFGLDRGKVPPLYRSTDIIGTVTAQAARLTGLKEGTPVVAGGGDGSCAAVGTGCVKPGVANLCLGTSSWISITSDRLADKENMSISNFAHIVPRRLMPTGTMQTGGGALSWAVNKFYGNTDGDSGDDIYKRIEKEVAQTEPGAKGLIFLPYLIGERSPRWNPRARGAFVGLTLEHGRAEMVRAVMESVAMNLDIVLNALEQTAPVNELTVIGGGARNKLWLQMFADAFNRPLVVPNVLEEATSMGAAITAGVGVGLFPNFDVIERFLTPQYKVLPNPENVERFNSIKPKFEQCYQSLRTYF